MQIGPLLWRWPRLSRNEQASMAMLLTMLAMLALVGLMCTFASRAGAEQVWWTSLGLYGVAGALLVLAADTLGRALLPPLEVPAGIFTTLVGAPYFLYLLRRSA